MSFKKPQITGKYSFYVEIQPKLLFEAPITTLSTIQFTAFTNQSKIIPIPLIITWFRGKNGSFNLIEYSSLLYHVNGLDVGFYIKAQFRRKEEEEVWRKEEEERREGERREEELRRERRREDGRDEGRKNEGGEVIFGPVKIDISIRGTLENILGVGGSNFPVVILNEKEGCEKKVGKYKKGGRGWEEKNKKRRERRRI